MTACHWNVALLDVGTSTDLKVVIVRRAVTPLVAYAAGCRRPFDLRVTQAMNAPILTRFLCERNTRRRFSVEFFPEDRRSVLLNTVFYDGIIVCRC